MSIAVLIKQVPSSQDLSLGEDLSLKRDGVDLEINPYCRRALATALRLGKERHEPCIVLSMGPPSAERALQEALALGADKAVLLSDPKLAGSDILATSRALAAALNRLGPLSVVLCGKFSIDAETGLVPAQLAELLGFPLLDGVRRLDLRGDRAFVEVETDSGWMEASSTLPVLLTCAERLCSPARAGVDEVDVIDHERIVRLGVGGLGPGLWGSSASPTAVRAIRRVAADRLRRQLEGTLDDQVRAVVELVQARATVRDADRPSSVVPAPLWETPSSKVVVVGEPGRPDTARELLAMAADAAQHLATLVTVVVTTGSLGLDLLSGWGADYVMEVDAMESADEIAWLIGKWSGTSRPELVLLPSTTWGREVAGRIAARTQSGLVSDVIRIEFDENLGGFLYVKPALSGSELAEITSNTPMNCVTVRPGSRPSPRPRAPRSIQRINAPQVEELSKRTIERVVVEDDLEQLNQATIIVGMGMGVGEAGLSHLRAIIKPLNAELATTRKVTDRHWLPRSRQIGITGRHVAPEIYLAVGLSGKYNHMIGVSAARTVLAVNIDPSAPVFDHADLGIVGDWSVVLPAIVAGLSGIALPSTSTIALS